MYINTYSTPCSFWTNSLSYRSRMFLNLFFVCVVYLLRRYINPTENLAVAVMSVGEGWHNYHHVFPWDYKAAELGNYKFNFTTAFIDLFAKIGWAYDLKTASTELVRKRTSRTGLIESPDNSVALPWGWDDKDCPQSDRMEATIINRKKGWSIYLYNMILWLHGCVSVQMKIIICMKRIYFKEYSLRSRI